MPTANEEERECLLEQGGDAADTNAAPNSNINNNGRIRKITRRSTTHKNMHESSHPPRNGLKLLLLALANGLYLYFGGVIFYALENSPIPKVDTRQQLSAILNVIKETSDNFPEGSLLTSTDGYVQLLNNTHMMIINDTLQRIHEEWSRSEEHEWTLLSAVFFSSTVVTTIGYGNLAPVTPFGRAFCVLYAIVGMPLTLILLAMVGQILANYINEMCVFVTNSLRRYFSSDYSYQSTEDETVLKAPVWLAVLILCCFVSLDAVLFMYLEDWSFGDSLYFVFITFTTIGFGDMVPQNTKAVIFNVTFLYVGLAILSITLNLLTANIAQQVQEHKNKFNIVKNVEEILKDAVGKRMNKAPKKTDAEPETSD